MPDPFVWFLRSFNLLKKKFLKNGALIKLLICSWPIGCLLAMSVLYGKIREKATYSINI